jgi:hypothetical protein
MELTAARSFRVSAAPSAVAAIIERSVQRARSFRDGAAVAWDTARREGLVVGKPDADGVILTEIYALRDDGPGATEVTVTYVVRGAELSLDRALELKHKMDLWLFEVEWGIGVQVPEPDEISL